MTIASFFMFLHRKKLCNSQWRDPKLEVFDLVSSKKKLCRSALFEKCIPSLLFSQLGKRPLFEDFDGPVAPRGCIESKSLMKQNSYNLILEGVPYIKIPQFRLLIFTLREGTHLALRVPQIKKLYKKVTGAWF